MHYLIAYAAALAAWCVAAWHDAPVSEAEWAEWREICEREGWA